MKLWAYDYLDRFDDLCITNNHQVIANNKFKNVQVGDTAVVYCKTFGCVFAQAFYVTGSSCKQPWDKKYKFVYSIRPLCSITEIPFLTKSHFKRGNKDIRTDNLVFDYLTK